MQVYTQPARSLSYVTVYPEGFEPGGGYPLVILLHGFGAHLFDLVGLASALDSRGYIYVFPNAPLPVQVGPGRIGFAWMAPHGMGDARDALQTEMLLESCFYEVMARYQVAPGRALLAGFSQGGSMTYRLGLTHPELFAGLAVLSSGVRDTDELRHRLPPERTQPIFIAHGLQDNPERAQRSKAFLEEVGYAPAYKEYDIGHEISPEVIEDLRPWMWRVLPPFQAARPPQE